MSQLPPNGPPPPYYGHPPPPGSYAYVPAPMVMPLPVYPHAYQQMPGPSDTTYVTNNYIYGQPPQPEFYQQPQFPPQSEPVIIAQNKEVIDWVPATAHTAYSYSSRAVKAGHEGWDGSPLWVIRAYHGGEQIPGKLAVKHRAAYIPNAGAEIPIHNFEILCAEPGSVRWLPSNNGQVPAGAVVAGNTMSAEPLYVGRARHMLSLTPGKVHPSHGCCYISFSGNEISYKNYEVLCKIIG